MRGENEGTNYKEVRGKRSNRREEREKGKRIRLVKGRKERAMGETGERK